MLDFNKQLPPSAVKEKELLLQVTWDHLIAGLNEEVAGIIHLHVLLHPVRKVSEENLEGKKQHKSQLSSVVGLQFILWHDDLFGS